MKIIIIIILYSGLTLSQWTQLYTGTNFDFTCMSFLNSQTGWVAGENGIVIFTSNGGNEWITVSPNNNTYSFYCIQFIDNLTGWAGSYEGRIYKTINGGYNWSYVSVYYLSPIGKIHMLNSSTGYCIGNEARLKKTTDGGISWFPPGDSIDGLDLHFVNINTGFVPKRGTIFRTTNGGSTFDLVYSTNYYFALKDFSFLNQYTGFAMGYWRITVKTTNMGNNWVRISYDSTSINDLINSVSFIDNNIGYACGQIFIPPLEWHPILRKTTNGGFNWFDDTPTASIYSLEEILIVDGQTGYVIGYSGEVFKNINAGYVNIKEFNNRLPASYLLHQNYPNPFNPITKIVFDISASSPLPFGKGQGVRLSIYNTLGQEIETIINQELSPGTYEVEWDASNYPSGVYFYKLTSGSFTETKRMVLIK